MNIHETIALRDRWGVLVPHDLWTPWYRRYVPLGPHLMQQVVRAQHLIIVLLPPNESDASVLVLSVRRVAHSGVELLFVFHPQALSDYNLFVLFERFFLDGGARIHYDPFQVLSVLRPPFHNLFGL